MDVVGPGLVGWSHTGRQLRPVCRTSRPCAAPFPGSRCPMTARWASSCARACGLRGPVGFRTRHTLLISGNRRPPTV